MSFTLRLVDDYEWPVEVRVPNGGALEVHRFTARFRHLGLDQVQEMVQRVIAASREQEGRGADAQLASMDALVGVARLQAEQAMAYWVGWGDDLLGADGQPLPYSEETKARLLGVRIIREAVVAAWQASQSGDAARLGNSAGSPAGGPAEGDQ